MTDDRGFKQINIGATYRSILTGTLMTPTGIVDDKVVGQMIEPNGIFSLPLASWDRLMELVL